MVRLEAAEQQNENVERVDDPSAHHADAVWEEVGNVTSEFPETESTQSIAQQKVESQKLESQKLESQNEAGQKQITTSDASGTDPTNQETDAMQTHLENEKKFDGEFQEGELHDDDQIVDGSPASKLIQDLEAEEDLTVSRTVQPNSSLDSCSNLASSRDEGDGLRFSEYMRPQSQDASNEAESRYEALRSLGESGDLAGETTVGLHEADVDRDDQESKYANPQTEEFEQNLEVDTEITVSDEHEKKPPKLMECRAGENELGEKHESEESESVADFKLFDSEDEGDTLEAYMTRLLKDVLGDVDSTDVDSTDAESTDAESTDAESTDADSTDADETNLDEENPTGVNAEEQEDLEPLDPNAPIVHRSLASARDTDHSAMRELANTSARIAIQRVERLQSRNTQVKGMIRLVCALGAILSGAACYIFLFGFPMYLSVAMSGVIAIVYVREAIQLFQEASCQFNAATSAVQDDGSAPASEEKFADEKFADE
ncbi:hypothetical protein N9B39_00905, partial [bacterium]|nr:hypothetical protein [bacterium]